MYTRRNFGPILSLLLLLLFFGSDIILVEHLFRWLWQSNVMLYAFKINFAFLHFAKCYGCSFLYSMNANISFSRFFMRIRLRFFFFSSLVLVCYCWSCCVLFQTYISSELAKINQNMRIYDAVQSFDRVWLRKM